jgi:hypothetical protein
MMEGWALMAGSREQEQMAVLFLDIANKERRGAES